MLSPRRRQVIIAGLGTAVAPAAFAALPAIEAPQKLLLCGRVLGSDGRPLSGAAVVSGQGRAFPYAGGGVLLVSAPPRSRGSPRPPPAAPARRRGEMFITLAPPPPRRHRAREHRPHARLSGGVHFSAGGS